MDIFLAQGNREIKAIHPDGNCMFRSVADQVKGNAEDHLSLRHAAVFFIRDNAESFKGYLQKSSVEHWTVVLQQHLNIMNNYGCWGTQLELKAMASMLKVPIFVATDSLVPGECRWTVFLPQNDTKYKNHPLVDTWLQNSHGASWLEICHTNSSHYDSVKYTGAAPCSPPLSCETSLDTVTIE